MVLYRLRIGASLCSPHYCCHCGAQVDDFATHGLSCRWSEGCYSRHVGVNNIIHRALTSAKIPSRLEPSGLSRSDGKRPDGATIVPCKSGKTLAWDATCPNTFTPSYIMPVFPMRREQWLWRLSRERDTAWIQPGPYRSDHSLCYRDLGCSWSGGSQFPPGSWEAIETGNVRAEARH